MLIKILVFLRDDSSATERRRREAVPERTKDFRQFAFARWRHSFGTFSMYTAQLHVWADV